MTVTLSDLLNTALPIEDVSPLCQKPPSPTNGDRALVRLDIERRRAGAAEPVAHRGRADVERRQDREQVAADVAADVVRPELALDQLHGGEDRPLRDSRCRTTAGADAHVRSVAFRAAASRTAPSFDGAGAAVRRARPRGRRATNAFTPSRTTAPVYSPAIGSMPLPSMRVCTSARRRMVLIACSRNSGWPSSTIRIARLPCGEADDLARRSADR